MIKTLIVDDNGSFRHSFAHLLHQQFPSMVITETADADAALEKVNAAKPHLLFVDIQLPGENGLELTKKVKADWPSVVIAILTAYDLPEYREAAHNLGADYFFSKSVPIEELEAVIRSVESRLK